MKLTRSECLAYAAETLANPPRNPWTERHEPRGDLVYQFVLPLDLAQPQNRMRHAQGWQRKKERDAVLAHLRQQAHHNPSQLLSVLPQPSRRGFVIMRATAPLPGRPQVLAIRFTCVEPDAYSDWAKVAIDCLSPRADGLGIIADDKPSKLELRYWTEYARKGLGFALIQVRTGT
jgi:hypothetical protein